FGVLRFFRGLSGDLVIVLVTVLVTVTVLSGPTTVDGFGGFCGALRISVVRVTVVVVVDTEVSVIVAGPADPVTSPSTSGTAKTRPTTRAPVANTPPPIAKACCRFTVPPWRASDHGGRSGSRRTGSRQRRAKGTGSSRRPRTHQSLSQPHSPRVLHR